MYMNLPIGSKTIDLDVLSEHEELNDAIRRWSYEKDLGLTYSRDECETRLNQLYSRRLELSRTTSIVFIQKEDTAKELSETEAFFCLLPGLRSVVKNAYGVKSLQIVDSFCWTRCLRDHWKKRGTRILFCDKEGTPIGEVGLVTKKIRLFGIPLRYHKRDTEETIISAMVRLEHLMPRVKFLLHLNSYEEYLSSEVIDHVLYSLPQGYSSFDEIKTVWY